MNKSDNANGKKLVCVSVRFMNSRNTNAPIVLTFGIIWLATNMELKNKASKTTNTKATIIIARCEALKIPESQLYKGVTGEVKAKSTVPETKDGIHKATANKASAMY